MVTGMSGAGMSSSLKAFEDLGYEAVDNLRLGLVPALLDFDQTATKPLVIAIDTRNANFSIEAVLRVYDLLKTQKDVTVKLVFLECSDETLQRRFTETRRRHPLAVDRPVMDGIIKERALLAPLRDVADHVIDTSLLSIHDLRRLIAGHFPLATGGGLSIYVMSFSFRQGLPREADLVFDVRFLRNPYWDPALRDQTGQDQPVCAYIEEDEGLQSFMDHRGGLLLPLLPRYQQEGKSYLTIAVGCTGGRHRSVYVAERLARELAVKDYIVGVGHRDMAKANAAQAESGEK
jgi:UPF0042 nucleotide-binding protein